MRQHVKLFIAWARREWDYLTSCQPASPPQESMPPPVTLSLTRMLYVPKHTEREAGDVLRWNRMARQVYSLADDRRDVGKISQLLGRALSDVGVHVNVLCNEQLLYVCLEKKIVTMNVALLKESFDQIAVHGDRFAYVLYETLLHMFPSVKPLFAQTDLLRLSSMFMATLALLVAGIERGDNLLPVLHRLGEKHATRYHVQPQHYPLVGAALLASFREFLGPRFTDAHAVAWSEAYDIIARQMQNYREEEEETITLGSAS